MLASLAVLDGPQDSDFQRLCRMTAQIFGVEMALFTLLDSERQWFAGQVGAGDVCESATETSFCAHVIALPGESEVLVVPDARQDARFRDNPLVEGEPNIRFYAGAPIMVGGHKVGTICALSASPRTGMTPEMLEQLRDLGRMGSSMLALKDEARVRARTADALVREEWRHALTLEAGKVGSWVWDVRGGQLSCNDMFRRMFGLAESGVASVDEVLAAIHPADRSRVQAGIEASFEAGADFGAEARMAASGRWINMRGRVYQRDTEGRPLVMMGACTDITESKQSADHTKMLLRELNHRVKNTLAMIHSVARQTIRQNPDPQDFIEAFSGRLHTISHAHVLLADRDWAGVNLHEVIASQLDGGFGADSARAEVHGEDVMLPADHALGLGLVLHELTTNACRHGAWSGEMGRVRIDWTISRDPAPCLCLNWTESGGPRVKTPAEYGLGAKLIERSLAKVLDSQVSLRFEPDGVMARVWMPLPADLH